MKNLMDDYIHFTEKKANKYVRWILGKNFNKEITDEMLKTYVNARYYNIVNSEKRARAFYQRIHNELTIKEEGIKQKIELYEIKDSSVIEYTKKILEYLLFFDNVRNIDNFKNISSIKEIIEKMAEIKQKIDNNNKDIEFEKKLYNEIKNDILEKEIFLENIEDDELNLEFQVHEKVKNLYYVTLEHNIKMPVQYSDTIVKRVFDSGIIAEDKIEIEFILLSLVVVRDILNGNFEDTYISEFASSILKKEQKTQTILSRISNQALQEKIIINIYYEDLLKYNKKILKLIKEGYNFAITLDGAIEEIEKLNDLKMFKYVIIPQKHKLYKEAIKNKKYFQNLIEL